MEHVRGDGTGLRNSRGNRDATGTRRSCGRKRAALRELHRPRSAQRRWLDPRHQDGAHRNRRGEAMGRWEHGAMLGFIEKASAHAAPPVLLAAPVGPLHAEPHPEAPPESVAEPSATGLVRLHQPATRHRKGARRHLRRRPSPKRPKQRPASAAADATPPGLLAPIVSLRPDRTLLRAAQPFEVTLSLDLTNVAKQSERIIYSAVIVARQLGGRSGRTLGSPRGLLKVAGTTTITIDAGGLPPGIYILEAAVSLRAAGAQPCGRCCDG